MKGGGIISLKLQGEKRQKTDSVGCCLFPPLFWGLESVMGTVWRAGFCGSLSTEKLSPAPKLYRWRIQLLHPTFHLAQLGFDLPLHFGSLQQCYLYVVLGSCPWCAHYLDAVWHWFLSVPCTLGVHQDSKPQDLINLPFGWNQGFICPS